MKDITPDLSGYVKEGLLYTPISGYDRTGQIFFISEEEEEMERRLKAKEDATMDLLESVLQS